MKLVRTLGAIAGAAALALSVPVAANASVVHHRTCPTVNIYSDVHGRLTTPSPLHKGEVLKRIDVVGTYTVTSIRTGSPLDVVTVSPRLPKNNIFGFRTC